MTRVLTVDDSSTIRTIVSKQMTELGFEVEQAEDGEKALAKLEEIVVDLILLDVTMPVMDGPAMLAQLRASGNKTPVIMLTSESKKSIVSDAVKLGIDDYILKPFKPEELRAKVAKVLRIANPAGPIGASPVAAIASPVVESPAARTDPASRQFTDVLVVDDMENVHKKLRSLLPQHISMTGAASARDALNVARERVFRVVLVDTVMPDVNSVALMQQLRTLQPHAVMVALCLRTTGDALGEAKSQGFADALFKPFEVEALDEFLSSHFDVKDVLEVDGNQLRCVAFEGKEDKLDRYFTRLRTLAFEAFEKLASACYDDAILDLSTVKQGGDRVVRLVINLEKEGKRLGLSLRLVGTGDTQKALGGIVETASIPFFHSVGDAKAA